MALQPSRQGTTAAHMRAGAAADRLLLPPLLPLLQVLVHGCTCWLAGTDKLNGPDLHPVPLSACS